MAELDSPKRKEEVFTTPFSQTWKRFKKNKSAIIGLSIILFSIIIALLGFLITPDSTPKANNQILQIGTKSPGFKIEVLKVRKNRDIKHSGFLRTMFMGKENKFRLVPIIKYHFDKEKIVYKEYIGEDRVGYESSVDIVDVVYARSINNSVSVISNDSVYFFDSHDRRIGRGITDIQKEIEEKHISTKRFILGTDKFGRDILSRLIIGVRVSLSVGFIAVLISLIIGVTLGAIGGYFRGRVDDVIMWFVNVVWSIPTLLLVFTITLTLGKGFWQIFVAVGLTMWVEVARIVRGQVMSVRETEFIEATKALGFKDFRIVTVHILPNVLGPVMIIAAANFATAILIEAGLSFLGIGVSPPTPSWGAMLKESYGYIITHKPFLAIIPAMAIISMVLAFNLFGNGLRDALDVKSN